MASPLDPFEPFRAAYDVHPECDVFVQKAAEMHLQSYASLSVEDAREQHNRVGRAMNSSVHFTGSVTKQTIPFPAVPGGIPIKIYKPDSKTPKPAIFVYLHGGGLVVGSLVSYDTCLKTIAQDSGAVVVYVHYRLLPLLDDPTAPFDDALAAVRWVLANKATLSGHSHCKVGVGGDSAGGHLTASVTNEITDVDFQVLVYPMADVSRKQASFQEFAACPGLPKESVDWFFKHSVDRIPDALNDPKINPMARKNVELSPPALVLLAELDALRDGGIEYATKLRECGVPVELVVVPGVPHAFFHLSGVFASRCALAYGHVSRFIDKFQ